jgi:hypothetical protein
MATMMDRVRAWWSGRTPAPALMEQLKPANLGHEFGVSGTTILDGVITRDYLTELRGLPGMKVYDQMRRSDGQTQALLSVYKLPIEAASWYIEPATEDARDVEIADFVNYCLFEHGRQNWAGFLSEALTLLDFGYALFETVFSPGSGQYEGTLGLDRLAWRSPLTIERWYTDPETRELVEVVQQTELGQRYSMAGERLLCLTRRREGDNFEGTSLLRAPYKHWYIKDKLYRLQAIGLERGGVGIPVAQYPRGALQGDEVAAIKQILEQLRGHHQVYVNLPTDKVALTLLQATNLGPAVAAFQSAIDHHDLLIARSGLAQFLVLAGAASGSMALSIDQTEFFMHALNAQAGQIAAELSTRVIPALVKLNYGEQDRYPKLCHSPVAGDSRLSDWAALLKNLVEARLLIPDGLIEDTIRAEMELPERENVGEYEQRVAQVAPALDGPPDQGKGSMVQPPASDAAEADTEAEAGAIANSLTALARVPEDWEPNADRRAAEAALPNAGAVALRRALRQAEHYPRTGERPSEWLPRLARRESRRQFATVELARPRRRDPIPKFIPRGADQPLLDVPETVTFSIDEIAGAAAVWDREFPEWAGLLDARPEHRSV